MQEVQDAREQVRKGERRKRIDGRMRWMDCTPAGRGSGGDGDVIKDPKDRKRSEWYSVFN
jgi:hypothetical protein